MDRSRRRNEEWTRDPRSGMVLIELVAVIAVMAMLLAIVSTLFAGVYRIERSWSEAAAEGRELQRLAAYFREDAHRAAGVRIAEDGRSWSFMQASGVRVDYEVLAGAVSRTVRTARGDSSPPSGRQELSLPPGAEVDIHDNTIAEARMITLAVTAGRSIGGTRAAVLRVDAHLGRLEPQNLDRQARDGNEP